MSDFEEVADEQLAFLLADLVRESADLLLRGEQELTLNTDWLGYLATRFPACDRTEAFTPATFNFNHPEHDPLAFLFEIFQIIPKLTLFPGKRYQLMMGERYDLSIFRGLTALRLVRVEVSRIAGIHRLRAQLQSVECRRAMTSLAYLFCGCASDRVEVEMPWSALAVVNCASNSIRELDRSLGLFPHALDLNFADNGIGELSPALRGMRALVTLNLAHNQIRSLGPLLGREPRPYLTKLTTLNLSNNAIASLFGLERLTALERLNVSDNDIVDFDEVRRIRHILSLRQLHVNGNPICHQRHYRARVLALLEDWTSVELDGHRGGTLEEHVLVEHYIEVAGAGRVAPQVGQPRVVLQTPPNWKCNSRCYQCGAAFTWALGKTPRHHCRQCGESVCHEHSRNSLLLPHFGDEYAGPERVCDTCYVSLLEAVKPIDYAAARRESGAAAVPGGVPFDTSMAGPADLSGPAADDSLGLDDTFATGGGTPGRMSRQRRPKSAEIRDVEDPETTLDSTMDKSLTATPKKKRGRKKKDLHRKKEKTLNASRVLDEQDSLLEQVDQIFEAGGDKALEIYQAWVDQGNPELPYDGYGGKDSAAEGAVGHPDVNAMSGTGNGVSALVGDDAERAAGAIGAADNGGSYPPVTGPLESSTPNVTPVLPRKVMPVVVNQLLPVSPVEKAPVPRVSANGTLVVTTRAMEDADGDKSQTIIATPDDLLNDTRESTEMPSMIDDKPAESCDEFFVSLIDRTNRTVDRIIQVQGASSILIIDFITGKTVDMVDLACLVDIQQGEETPLLVRLSFIYGRKDRRVIEFVVEDDSALRELLDLLEPVAAGNKAGKLNETVSALFKCLRCDAVFPFEEQRFEGPSVSCQVCRSNEVVEFFVHAPGGEGAAAAAPVAMGVGRTSNPSPDGPRADMASPGGGSVEMSYSVITDDDHVDCRTIDHTRKLLLDLEHFEDGERSVGGIDCVMFTAATGVVSAFVVLSTKALYALTVGPDGALALVHRIAFRDIQHVSVAVNSIRVRLGLSGRTHLDLLIGDELRTWDFVQLLGDAPALSDCVLRVDSAMSDAISREVPTALVQGGMDLGCLQDLVSRTSRATELRQRLALISEADGNPVVLCAIAMYENTGGTPCVLVAEGTNLHIFQLYPADPSMYVAGGGFSGKRVVDIQEIEKVQYSKREPRRIRLIRWPEGSTTAAGEHDDFTAASTRVLRHCVEQLNGLWTPLFGFDIPIENVRRS